MFQRLHTLVLAVFLLGIGSPAGAEGMVWKRWDPALFAEARASGRFVLLDLGAVWCHWCHVMDRETYADPEVMRLIGSHYVAVHADQDADPALTARYGDWGWPATIILAPDGSELVKRRGYIPPLQMASLLQAVVDDPAPGPSVQPEPRNAGDGAALGAARRAALAKTIDEAWDEEHAGWGTSQKFLPAAAIDWLLARAERGDVSAMRPLLRTLDANLALLDPVDGGVFQYSDTPDWRSPHYEKIMSYQADDLRLYALAWARFQDPAYLAAAQSISRYLRERLRAPGGGYWTSQDADLSARISGRDWYALDAAGRRALGEPRIDRHRYTRDNAWAIAALCALHDATGDRSALVDAISAARWVIRARSRPGGGFRHDVRDDSGVALADNLAMARALLALHRSTGEAEWLRRSISTLRIIDRQLRDPAGGYDAVPAAAGAIGVFAKPVRVLEDNLALARLANLVAQYSGEPAVRAMAQHALRYVAAPAIADSGLFLPGLLLVDEELAREPLHVAVVGAPGAPGTRVLRDAALAYPSVYSRVEFLDRAGAPRGRNAIRYPRLKRSAAFACSGNRCSLPVFDPAALASTVDRLAKTDQPATAP